MSANDRLRSQELIASNRELLAKIERERPERDRKIREALGALKSPCARGQHFFRRDTFLGWPVGRPYCMWCGVVAGTGKDGAA